MRAGALDQLARGDALVAGEVVHDDDVSWLERWRENVADVGLEPVAVDGAVQDHGGDHAAEPQARDQRGGLSVAVGEAHPQPGAARTPPVAAGHVGCRPGLVDEDQALGVEVWLGVEPGAPLLQNVRAVLLDRVAGLFFRVIPRRWKKRDSADLEVAIPRAASRSHNSISV